MMRRMSHHERSASLYTASHSHMALSGCWALCIDLYDGDQDTQRKALPLLQAAPRPLPFVQYYLLSGRRKRMGEREGEREREGGREREGDIEREGGRERERTQID